jgi:acyl dehydratase
MVRHTKLSFRGPAFEGDVTFVDGEVTAKQPESPWGVPLAAVKLQMTNQEGAVLVDGYGEVELPP